MAHIDYYFATISPYTYLAGTRLEAVAQKHGATITYKPCDLMAVFGRTGGTPPAQRHESRQQWRAQEMPRQAKKLGMAFNSKPAHFPTNMAPSSYAFIAAQNAGGGDLGALVHAFTRSVWADDKDVADDAVIRACLEEAGFEASLADSGLLAGAEAYAQNTEDAVANGAFGAPFYIIDGTHRLWGQDRIEDVDMILAGTL